MLTTVYVETTILSYLTAKPSRDLIVAAHQQITRAWWDEAVKKSELFVSEAVLEEIREGDPQVASRRINQAKELRVLTLSSDVEYLIEIYSRRLGLTGSASADLPHLAYAVAYGMDYLTTWNCAHIANGQMIRRLLKINREIGWETPVILTPEGLKQVDEGD